MPKHHDRGDFRSTDLVMPESAESASIEQIDVLASHGRAALRSIERTLRQKFSPGDYVVVALREKRGSISASANDFAADSNLVDAVRQFRKQFPGVAGYVHRVGEDI